MTDRFDRVIEGWSASRPELDFTPLEVVTRVLRAAHYLQIRLDGLASAYGLSHRGDLEVLTDLDLEGPQTPSELAESLLLTSGGMTVRLNRLQAAGLVERHPNPHDGRGVLVHLTPTGSDLARDALINLLQSQAQTIEGLAQGDRDHLTRLLRSLLITLGDFPAFSPTVSVKRMR